MFHNYFIFYISLHITYLNPAVHRFASGLLYFETNAEDVVIFILYRNIYFIHCTIVAVLLRVSSNTVYSATNN